MSLKETIFSMMNEALNEAVEVRHDRYMRSHGKKARDSGGGSSSWMFTHKNMGDVNVNDKAEVHTAQGKFADAKKSAQAWGKQHGHSSVYVMEEVELDELKVPSKFQKAVFKLAHGKTPKEYAAFNKADSEYQSSDTLKRLKVGRTDDNTYKKGETPKDKNSVIHGSPAHMQIRAIDRELKKRNEEVDLDEGHGVFLQGGSVGERRNPDPIKVHDDIADAKDHAKRMNKLLSPGEKKHYRLKYTVKPVSEEVELDEAETPTYHYYATKNGIGAKEMKLTHSKSKPFTSETDAFNHIVKTGGRQDGIIHKVNSATGKVVQHRGIDGGQKGYPTPASDMASDAPKHVRDLKEEVQVNEGVKEKISGIIRREKQKDYPLLQNRRDVAATKAGSAYAVGDHKKGDRYMKWRDDNMKKEEVELDEAKTDIYHKHMLKALGKTRLPKDHGYTSAIANNGDFVVRDSSSVVARIPKGEHNIKEQVEELDEISQEKLQTYHAAAGADRLKAKATVQKSMDTKKPATSTIDKATAAYSRFKKRGQGMTIAANKMSEQIDRNE